MLEADGMNYTGIPCPVCHKVFSSQDDVVVCPDCGTPHHRHCWQEVGHCINQDKHAEGFTFSAPIDVNPAVTICKNCGQQTRADAAFCEHCGAQLPLENASPFPFPNVPTDDFNQSTYTNPEVNAEQNTPSFQNFFGLNEQNIDTETIDDIPVKDWVTYIGPNAGYYLFHFKRMDATGSKTGSTISAVLFSALYFFYRKMWKWGIVSGAISVLLQLPTLIITYKELGLLPASFDTTFLSQLVMPCTVILLLVSIAWGFLALPLYRKDAGAKIKKLQAESATVEEYQAKLQKKAGPSRIVFMIGAFIFITYFFIL